MRKNKLTYLSLCFLILSGAVIILKSYSKNPDSETEKTKSSAGNGAIRQQQDSSLSASSGSTNSTEREAQEIAKDRAAATQIIQQASTTYDPAELHVIQPYLTHSDGEIRSAAIDAMIVLGSSEAAPMLRDAAKKVSSMEESIKMERAASYLELPPADVGMIREMMKKKKGGQSPQQPAQNR